MRKTEPINVNTGPEASEIRPRRLLAYLAIAAVQDGA